MWFWRRRDQPGSTARNTSYKKERADAASPAESPAKAAAKAKRSRTAKDAGEGDDLTRINGVGPKLAEKLMARGITRFAQIADWSDADIAALDGTMLSLKGRIVRDEWVEQARLLAAGDLSAWETRFGYASR